MTKKELALEVIRRLKRQNIRFECSLDYDDLKLLVSVRLAAQCTDAKSKMLWLRGCMRNILI